MLLVGAQQALAVDFTPDVVEVADGENAGFHAVADVAEHAPQVPLGLRHFAPCLALQGEEGCHFAGGAVLALAEPRVGREARDDFLLRLHVLVARFRRLLVAVVDEPVEERRVGAKRPDALFEELRAVARERKPGDAGSGDVFLHNPRSADVESGDLLRSLGRGAVGGRDVRLVPHEPLGNASGEVTRDRIDPGVPGGEAFFGGGEAGAEVETATARVNRVESSGSAAYLFIKLEIILNDLTK